MNRDEVKHALESTFVSVLATTPQSETREERPLASFWRSLTRESLDPRLPGTLTITQIGVHVAEAQSQQGDVVFGRQVRVIPTGDCAVPVTFR